MLFQQKKKNKEVCGIKRIYINESKERALLWKLARTDAFSGFCFSAPEDASVLAGYCYRKAPDFLFLLFNGCPNSKLLARYV